MEWYSHSASRGQPCFGEGTLVTLVVDSNERVYDSNERVYDSNERVYDSNESL